MSAVTKTAGRVLGWLGKKLGTSWLGPIAWGFVAWEAAEELPILSDVTDAIKDWARDTGRKAASYFGSESGQMAQDGQRPSFPRSRDTQAAFVRAMVRGTPLASAIDAVSGLPLPAAYSAWHKAFKEAYLPGPIVITHRIRIPGVTPDDKVVYPEQLYVPYSYS